MLRMDLREPMADQQPALEQPEFGRRLRAVRRQRDLSQADVAGDELSPSYVSLLENGRRTPTAGVAERLITRLGMTAAEFWAADATQAEGRRRALVERLLAARAAADDREYGDAAERLRTLLKDAVDDSEPDIAWETRWDLVDVLDRVEAPAERLATLAALAADPLTTSSVALQTRVLARLAGAHREVGEVKESIEVATRALDVSQHLPIAAPERVRALIALLAARADNTELEEATGLADQLAAVIDAVTSAQSRAAAYWAIGNVRFMAGAIDDAVAQHDLAFRFFRPESDVRQWARLSKGSAMMRLNAGVDTDGASRLLRQARQGLELVGTPTDLAELRSVEARYRLVNGDPAAAIELAEQALREPESLAAQDLADCYCTVARAHVALGNIDAAAAAYRTCGDKLEEAGLYRRAVQVLRELSELLAGGHPAAPP